ncbi:heme ABC transporter permease [Govanella unica]|uniref:Heme exporter protein C n=1 Tax=Govanella unica TaxID=2975056 RepID=A0A9X3TVC3_9PROT|nr:heme ABC transporter permease [Govania unica]MDA5192710.1 heme ABC transporter permease [Govania unica]
MYKYANPAEFQRLAQAILPWAGGLTVILFVAGLYFALFASPADYQQGDTVRIMYLHVPAAWMALFTYMVIAGASITSLIWKHPLADVAARAAAPIGAGFTALALLTGMFWGEPMWGTWWVWDARLTSFLVLFFIYLGYIALWDAIDNPVTAARSAAILAIVGMVNIPIIKFSVDWWNTLHQPASVFKMGKPTIDTSMLIPLFLMFLAFNAYFVTMQLWRMRAELNLAKIRALEAAARARAERAEEAL